MKKPTLREMVIPTKATIRWWLDTYFDAYTQGTLVDHLHKHMVKRLEQVELVLGRIDDEES